MGLLMMGHKVGAVRCSIFTPQAVDKLSIQILARLSIREPVSPVLLRLFKYMILYYF
jgi:hypothetical protein